MTLISRTSLITGCVNTMDLPITEDMISDWIESDALIQHAFPNLSADEREFLLTGATPAEFHELFAEEELDNIS